MGGVGSRTLRRNSHQPHHRITASSKHGQNQLTNSSRERPSRRNTCLKGQRLKNMPQNQAVTIELEDSENLDNNSTQEPTPCSKEKFSWASLSKYLREAWTGVISGTAEPIFEDLDVPHRYRPENLQLLCDATGFSVVEMKRIYRGFKTECPTGLITEEAFHGIYSRFFPQGAHFLWKDARGQIRSSIKPANKNMSKKEKKDVQNSQANVSSYSHYVFSTLDHEDSGIITFEDFVIGLSILLRGSVEEKARWMFLLYDQDRDGFISREEMEDVVGSVFDLMGRTSDPIMEEEFINQRVDIMFERMDLNG